MFMHPGGKDLAHSASLIEKGKLKVAVDDMFAREGARRAVAYLETD